VDYQNICALEGYSCITKEMLKVNDLCQSPPVNYEKNARNDFHINKDKYLFNEEVYQNPLEIPKNPEPPTDQIEKLPH
jgi:hypothetical protein